MKNVKRVKGPTPRPILYPTPPSALRLFRRKRPTMTQLSVTGVVLRTHRAPSSAATEKPTSASPTAAGTALRTSATIDLANRPPESAGGALIHRTFPLPQDPLCPTAHASGAQWGRKCRLLRVGLLDSWYRS